VRHLPRFAIAISLCIFGLSGASTTRADLPEAGMAISYHSFFDGWPPQPYVLDPVERFLPEGVRRVRCEHEVMVLHRNRQLRYTVRVHPAFVERLERFEALAMEMATEHYGRSPRRLIHKGAFACRSARGRRGRISEHAFGNALDFQGFDFGRLPRNAEIPEGMPRRFRRPFRLRVLTHWSPRRSRDDYHAVFLHELAETLHRRPDIFRGIVGPPRQRHRDHLHLDAAPWRYAMFGYEPIDEED
jgi:hypothetical protein